MTKENAQTGEKLEFGKVYRRRLCDVIAANVLRTLGEPEDRHQVQVRELWGDHYRVNVFVGPDALTMKVADSFFLQADVEGNILASAPAVTKRY